jgi:hypothetical protein
MIDSSHPAPIWLIWPYLSLLEKLSFLALCTVGVYWLFLAGKVVHFRSTVPVQENLARIRKRVRNLQQATAAAFCFFGFVLCGGLQFAYATIDNSNVSVVWLVVRNFRVHFAFAGNVFFVLLIFQFLQWFVANRVAAFGLDSKS